MAEHIDLGGFRRRGNEWGFNSFVDADECEKSVRSFARKRTHWWLWQLSDGTFTHTAVPDPKGAEYPTATLVKEFDT